MFCAILKPATNAPAWEAGVHSIMSICFARRWSTLTSDSSYSFQFNEMAGPAGLEPAAFCLEAMQCKTLTTTSDVAYEGARHLSRP